MEPPLKRCRLCHQALPKLPQLPFELIDKVFSHLPFDLHVDVVGASAATRRRALRRPDRLARYHECDPAADELFAAYWSIDAADPARPYVGQLCRSTCPSAAQTFFNERVPRAAAMCMLNAPRAESDSVLTRRWNWWGLARTLLIHEANSGRGRRPARVRVDADEACIGYHAPFCDASVFEFNAQPDHVVFVLLDDDKIELNMYGKRVYRIVV